MAHFAIPDFDGTDANWENWRCKLDLGGIGARLEIAAEQTAFITNEGVDALAVVVSRTVHALLITKCERTALFQVSSGLRRQGFEAWRVLVQYGKMCTRQQLTVLFESRSIGKSGDLPSLAHLRARVDTGTEDDLGRHVAHDASAPADIGQVKSVKEKGYEGSSMRGTSRGTDKDKRIMEKRKEVPRQMLLALLSSVGIVASGDTRWPVHRTGRRPMRQTSGRNGASG